MSYGVFRDAVRFTPSPRGGEGGMRGLRRCDSESSLPPHPTLSPCEIGCTRFRHQIVRKSGKPDLRWRRSETLCQPHSLARRKYRAIALWAAALCAFVAATARAEPVEEFFAGRQ